MKNFLPSQYAADAEFTIKHNYLLEQFADHEEIWLKIKEIVIKGDFTLGNAVDELEDTFAEFVGGRFAAGVGSGTDALFLSLKALEVGRKPGDEVITPCFSFYATTGAIVTAGARPVFVDCRTDFNIDPELIERSITENTRAILPVHWAGSPCDVEKICNIGSKYQIPVVFDACHASGSLVNGAGIAEFGDAACFSFHPLKNLNVWGDGGVVVTNRSDLVDKIKLIRNHGLMGRDECLQFSYNSRLDTIQAVVASHMMKKLPNINQKRIKNSVHLKEQLAPLERAGHLRFPTYQNSNQCVYHLFSFMAEDRNSLVQHLRSCGVDAKIHYPKPLHLQPASSSYGYQKGDFPVAEDFCLKIISLPVHEFVTEQQLSQMVKEVRSFYEC